MHCDNQGAMSIGKNPSFHEHTKHNKIGCHVVHDRIFSRLIDPPHVNISGKGFEHVLLQPHFSQAGLI